MLQVNRLREFVAEAVSSLPKLKKGYVVVSKDEIVNFMREHSEEQNILLIGIVPEHDFTGMEDAWLFQNDLGFYLLAKTDYSEIDHDMYLDLFAHVQEAVKEFIAFIMNQTENSKSVICELFGRFGDKINIPISPVKGLSGCNGYFVGLNFDSDF